MRNISLFTLVLFLMFTISCEKQTETDNKETDKIPETNDVINDKWVEQVVDEDLSIMNLYGYSDELVLFNAESPDFNGLIYKSIDMGLTWSPLYNKFNNTITNMCILSESVFYISVYHDGIYKTTDQGETFEKLYDLKDWNPVTVYFTSESNGYMFDCCSDQHKITLDGGKSWEWFSHHAHSEVDAIFNTGVEKAQFIDNSSIGFVLGAWDGIVLKTTDSEYNWENKRLNEDEILSDMFFIDSETGYLLDWDIIIKTTDGGETWTTINNETGGYNIWAFENEICYLLNQMGVFKSEDDAKSFSRIDDIGLNKVNTFYFSNDSTGIAAGWKGAVFTLGSN